MWAIGRYDLGLTDGEFWGLTLKLFLLLVDRHREAQRMENRRAGEVIAATYNVHRDTKKRPEPLSWLDFFPEDRPKPKAGEQTEEEMRAMLRRIYAAALPSGKEQVEH